MQVRKLFRSAERFSVYYGAGHLEKLVQYDAVVVEPGHRSAEEVQALQNAGTVVLAYVSVMEAHDEHPLRSFVKEQDYLRSSKAPYDYIMQPEYHNRIVSLESASWRGHLLRHIGQLLTRDGYDGVFFDTIGDVEMPNLPNVMQQVEAATRFVAQVRAWFPDKVLVQNNGLELLCTYTAPHLDAITWENPPLDIPDSRLWVNAVSDRLVRIRLANELRVFVLFEGERQDTRVDFLRGMAFAQTHGFTAYFSPLHYQSFH